jgi:hypothetical protein
MDMVFVTPAKAGVQGNRWSPGPWIPAFAGMTNSDFRPGSEAF